MEALKRVTHIAACFLTLSASTVFAGGLWIYENGSPDMGTASAGRAALATDASTAHHNPAGMANLDRSQLLVGIVPMYVDGEFRPGPASTETGGSGGNPVGTMMLGSVAGVHKINENWSAGIWAGSYFGFGVDYGESWAGRYFMTKGDLLTYGLNPTISYKINDRFSIGGGMNLIRAELLQEASVKRVFKEDGKFKLEDDDLAVGGNLGLMVNLSETTRVGLTYVSKVDLTFKDILTVTGTGSDYPWLNNLKIDYEMTIPQALMVSGYHALSDELAVMGNLGWQDWSDFGKQDLMVTAVNQTALAIDNKYQDTWHLALGIQYRLDAPWLLSAGFAYDSSLVKDEDRTVDLNSDRQYRFATGIQYDWSEEVTLGAAYQYVDGGSAPIHQSRGRGGPLSTTLQGDYDPNQVHYLSLNVIWRY